MQDTYLTTILILAWCIAISVAWTALAYVWSTRIVGGEARDRLDLGQGIILPGLVLAPVMLVISFRVFGINLLFPSAFEATILTTVSAATAPAFALFLSSGLGRSLWRTLGMQYHLWQRQPFATAAVAYGSTRELAVRRLVVLKSFLAAWAQSLPWLYGELIIIEAVFNAPGLGLSAWDAARQRDHLGLLTAVAGLIALYAVSVAISSWVSHWLGRRLESYG